MSDHVWDSVVVGSGAAGLAAAVAVAAAGLSVVVLGRSLPGGGVREWSRLETVPGHPVGLSGEEYAARIVARAEAYGVYIAPPAAVNGLEACSGEWCLRRADGVRVRARSVVAATGAARTWPRVPGLEAFLGAGVYPGLTPALAAFLADKDVFVDGDAEPAARLTLRLSECARSVTLLGLAARSGCDASAAHRGRDNVALREDHHLAGVLGIDHVETVVLRVGDSFRTIAREAGAVFVAAPVRPRTRWLDGAVPTGPGHGILTGSAPGYRRERLHRPNETVLPGVFAAGSVREGSGDGWEVVADGIAAAGQVVTHVRGRSDGVGEPSPNGSFEERP